MQRDSLERAALAYLTALRDSTRSLGTHIAQWSHGPKLDTIPCNALGLWVLQFQGVCDSLDITGGPLARRSRCPTLYTPQGITYISIYNSIHSRTNIYAKLFLRVDKIIARLSDAYALAYNGHFCVNNRFCCDRFVMWSQTDEHSSLAASNSLRRSTQFEIVRDIGSTKKSGLLLRHFFTVN